MANTRRTIEQIIEVRKRRHSDIATAELFGRLLSLQSSFERRAKDNPELLRHYPVALVACMEAFFRLAIKQLIDSDERYLRNAASLASRIKLDFEVVKALHGKEISLGDLLAHVVSINNLGDIAAQMSALLDKDYLRELASIHDRWAVEIEKKPKAPIITDPDSIYGSVARTFELRHIFCHEFATDYKFEPEEIERCFESSVTFMKAADEHLSEVLHPNAPLTQTDMNIASYKEYEDEKARLDAHEATLLSHLSPDRQGEYDAVQAAWDQFFELSTSFEADQYKGGSIAPLIANTAATALTRTRIEQVLKLIDAVTNV